MLRSLVATLVAVPLLAVAHEPPVPGGIAPPRLVRFVEPRYPDEARERGEHGDVTLELEIAKDGHVAGAAVVKGATPTLDAAAREAALRFLFEPARDASGRPLAAIVTFVQHFAATEPRASPNKAPPPPKPEPPRRYAATVTGERDFTAASSSDVADRDFLLRPRNTPSDILRVVPGLVTAQHAGGGKADQLFLRGFDADHGTDVAVFVDGVPVNMPSHGHGQGYADLHWLIPEAVQSVGIRKGPYFAEYGDFDTAGAVALTTRERFDASSVSALGGQLGTFRFLGVAAPEAGAHAPWLAVEAYGTDGPFDYPQGLRRYNVFAKDTYTFGGGDKLSFLATGYGAQWRASGQIPARWVGCDRPGCISPFGSVDPTEGGSTERQMAVAHYLHQGEGDAFDLGLYAVRSRLALFSDFTFQAKDPVHGDEIEQTDDRVYTGIDARWRRKAALLGRPVTWTLGAQSRFDTIDADLVHVERRVPLADCFADAAGSPVPNPCKSTRVRQSGLAAFAEADWHPLERLRLVAGLRGDLFEWDVTDLRPLSQRGSTPDASGIAQKSIVSPKASAVVTLPADLALFANFGMGFHSNDARAAVSTHGAGALPRATGGELGARERFLSGRLEVAPAVWYLRLASEQVYNGDEGTTEPSDPTTRYGVDLELRAELLPWLFADLDVSLAHAEYTVDHGNGRAVALAPTQVAAGGFTVRHPLGIQGSLRMRHIGDRAANQAGTVTASGYTIFDLQAAYHTARYEVGVIVENLLDSSWREAQFDDTSRLAGPPWNEPAPVEGIHFTPGAPRNARAFATLFF